MPERAIRVLVVEDNSSDALLVRMTLRGCRGARFDVHESDRLAAAIPRIRDELFDVVLLDLGLPDSHGLETFLRAKEAAHGRSPAFIVLSGFSDENVALDAVQAGAQDYLLKSYDMKDLLPRALRYAIERRKAQEQIEAYARQLQIKNKELQEELLMAREIQQALLPHQYPRFSNRTPPVETSLRFTHCYRPASTLSGDFFDVLHLSDNQAGVFICDVMGHGVRAALIGALARGLIEQLRPVAADPGRFLTAVNRSLCVILGHTGISAFVTAFYMVTDLAQRRLQYANAGHPSPLLIHRNESQVEKLRDPNVSRNPPLGLFDEFVYPTVEASVAAHDSVILFTDGIYEAESWSAEDYGRHRLKEAIERRAALPCDRIFEELVAEVQEFSGREEFEDDVCMIGMDVLNSGPGERMLASP